MKKLFLLCFAACLCALASAQKVYFLYLQSDNQTPFYVKLGDKIHSSAASGYLIIPNLTDGTYTFGLGFAKSSAAEARFSVTINENDKGYIVKNFDEGLALFDIKDLSLVKANASEQDNTVYETKSDRFSTVLSKAANDPSLLKVPVVKKDEAVNEKAPEKQAITAKADESKPVEQPATDTAHAQVSAETAKADVEKEEAVETDSAATPSAQTAAIEPTEPAVQPLQQEEKKETAEPQATAFAPSVITRYSESSTTEGFGVVYFDKREEGTDTIRILIPASKVKFVAEVDSAPTAGGQTKIDQKDTVEVRENDAVATTTDETKSPEKVITVSQDLSNCKNIASDKDFLKLRKRMAAEDTDDDMLDEARKEFRNRCFSVEQVRYLSTLFLNSASKYRFFDVAYAHVSDRNNFASLGAEITDEYYSKRFKALIGE